MDEYEDILKRAAERFGYKSQFLKLSEELAELITAISKRLNNLPSNIEEEIADVEIMLAQAKRHIPSSIPVIEQIKKEKLERFKQRFLQIEKGDEKAHV